MKNFLIIDAFNFVLIAAGASIKYGNKMMDIFDSIILTMIQKLFKIFPGYKMYACWDEYGGTQFRKDIDSEYKSNRSNKFIDFQSIMEMKKVFEVYNIENISLPYTEADDTIFCLCKVLKEKNKNSLIEIISRDKDLIQVVQAGYADSIYDYTKKSNVEIPWYSIVDYKSLVGDSSDKIKGVHGIGKKKAESILIEYMSSGKMNLTESQLEEFNKSKLMVDATLHPSYQENLTKLKDIIYERSQLESG